MQKYILVVALCFNLSAMASAIADPLALFVNQCLQYHADIEPFHRAHDIEEKTLALEKTLLGLHNINDRLNYYRSLVKDSLHGQDLLLCQVHLADELNAVLQHESVNQWTHYLALLPSPYPDLGATLQALQGNILPVDIKSKLHTAQSSINYSLHQRQFSLQFNDPDCELKQANIESDTATKQPQDDEISLSRYLLTHPNRACRRSAWIHYQTRVKVRNAATLSLIKALRNDLASLQGFSNFGRLQLSRQALALTDIEAFLNSQTRLGIAPWDLAQALAQREHHFTPLKGKETLSALLLHLTQLGLVIETLEPEQPQEGQSEAQSQAQATSQVLRVWHHGRLLGELFVSQGAHNRAHRLRQTLVGHQFGQMAISYQETITKRAEAVNLITALSDSINSLASGAPFYFIATLGQNDKNAVASEWLSLFMADKLPLENPSPRELLLMEHKLQMAVFKSKLALSYYLEPNTEFSLATKASLSEDFALGFTEPLEQANDLIYNFPAIANEGISYYLPLWHRSLAELIFQQASPLCAEDIFTVLVVNEHNAHFTDQLAQLIKGPVDPLSLIRRLPHASFTQE